MEEYNVKKALFIISLRYPLFNAINIKLQELTNKEADIIIDDTIRPDSQELIDSLISSKIFENVYFMNPDGYVGLKKYIKKQCDSISIKEAFVNSLKNIKLEIDFKYNKLDYLKKTIVDEKQINLESYDEVYVCSQTNISWICIDYLNRNKKISSIHMIEEGVRDYYTDEAIRKYSELYRNLVIYIHLYEPELIGYSLTLPNVKLKSIPKISLHNEMLKRKVNNVFGYKEGVNFDNKIIFFEQVAEPMPEYLKKMSFLKSILLRNALKKHERENYEYEDKIMIVDKVLDYMQENNMLDRFIIKLHPRTKRGYIHKWKEFIVGDKDNGHTIPWEVYCLNQEFNNNVWLTINSSSIINRSLCIEDDDRVRYVLFNDCINHKTQTNTMLTNYYNQFSKKFQNKLIIPKKIEDFYALMGEMNNAK